MRDLHIVLPMAGAGSRFAKVGFTTPKPLIEVDGLPMFKKALSSLAGIQAKKHYTVVIRKEHEQQYGLKEQLKSLLTDVNVVITNEKPIGALKDAMRAEPFFKNDQGIIILDCDLWFNSHSYNEMVQSALAPDSMIAGGLLTFPADNPRYSYADVDNDGNVTLTAEKNVISSRAILGAYFFGTADILSKAAHELMEQPLSDSMPEYYVSYVYNLLLAAGGKVKATNVDEFDSFGTPEELSAYQQGHSHQT